MRDGFIFYASFYEAIRELDAEQQSQAYSAIIEYALYGIVPEISGVIKSIFLLVKPQIDANNQRYANGRKGGRPAKSEDSVETENQTITESKPNDNQTETKPKPNHNQTITKPKPKEKEKEKDKEKDKDKEKENTKEKENRTLAGATVLADEFESIWRIYPNKRGKKKALAAYIRARKNGSTYEAVYEGVERYVRFIRDNRIETQFIKHGSTFFNGAAWEDVYGSASDTEPPPEEGITINGIKAEKGEDIYGDLFG